MDDRAALSLCFAFVPRVHVCVVAFAARGLVGSRKVQGWYWEITDVYTEEFLEK